MAKLSAKQREILQWIADSCTPRSIGVFDKPRVIPAYSVHIEDDFRSYSECRRFLENLERREFIRIEKDCFLYITEAGKQALQ